MGEGESLGVGDVTSVDEPTNSMGQKREATAVIPLAHEKHSSDASLGIKPSVIGAASVEGKREESTASETPSAKASSEGAARGRWAFGLAGFAMGLAAGAFAAMGLAQVMAAVVVSATSTARFVIVGAIARRRCLSSNAKRRSSSWSRVGRWIGVIDRRVCGGRCACGRPHSQRISIYHARRSATGTDRVVLTNGARINVPAFNGVDRVNTGNLELIAQTISIDAATSSIVADGAGYQPGRCVDGAGPTTTAGGRGGCGVRDSGGGGAHFGGGGRGTKDCTNGAAGCVFPRDYEEDCVGAVVMASNACVAYTDCRNNDALPSVAGAPPLLHLRPKQRRVRR